jgi:hypothetical protein
MRLAWTHMFKRSNRRFLFGVGNAVKDSLGNLSIVISAGAAQETKKGMTTLPTI